MMGYKYLFLIKIETDISFIGDYNMECRIKLYVVNRLWSCYYSYCQVLSIQPFIYLNEIAARSINHIKHKRRPLGNK